MDVNRQRIVMPDTRQKEFKTELSFLKKPIKFVDYDPLHSTSDVLSFLKAKKVPTKSNYFAAPTPYKDLFSPEVSKMVSDFMNSKDVSRPTKNYSYKTSASTSLPKVFRPAPSPSVIPKIGK